MLWAWNLNPDRTVRSNRETLEPFTSTVHLRWRAVSCEKSMELSGPQSDHPVLWTVTGSHGSNGLPCFSLKQSRFVPFFPLIRRRLGHFVWITLKRNPQVPYFLNHSLPLPHSLNHSLVSASLPRRRRSSLFALSSSPSFGTIINFYQFLFFFMLCSRGTRFGCVWLYLVSVRSKL